MVAYTQLAYTVVNLLQLYYVSLSAATPATPAAAAEFPLVAPRSSVSLSVATVVIEEMIMITCVRGSRPQELLPWAQDVFFHGVHSSAYYLGLKNDFWGPESRGCMITSMKGFGQVGCMTCAFLCEPDHGRHYHLKTPLEHYIMY